MDTDQSSQEDQTVSFRDVFKAELKEIEARRGKDGGPVTGLPIFKVLEGERADTSPAFHAALDILAGKKNDQGERDSQKEIDGKWTTHRADPNDPAPSPEPRNYCLHDGLVGLAFSGGGIRSATFNLGVLQALEKCNLYKSVDYLSTVSGGGYLGSCLSSLCASPSTNAKQTNQAEFPFKHSQGNPESDAFRHLRNNANYMAPKGLFDLLKAPAILLRGVAINILILLPYVLAASIITIIFNPTPAHLGENFLPLFNSTEFAGTLTFLTLLLLSYLSYPLINKYSGKVRKHPKFLPSLSKAALAIGLEKLSKWILQSKWHHRESASRYLAGLIAVICIFAFVEFQPVAIQLFEQYLFSGGMDRQNTYASLGFVGAILSALSAGNLAKKPSELSAKAGLILLGILGFLSLWFIYLMLCRWVIFAAPPSWLYAISNPPAEWIVAYFEIPDTYLGMTYAYGDATVYLVFGLLLFLYALWSVDVNSISLHNFYRDKLSKAYLIRFDDKDCLVHNDNQKLSELNFRQSPYHLICAAINLTSHKEAHRTGRRADTFLFSKNFIGGPETRYCDTEYIEHARPHVNLGTAMAISGAAFAGTAGKATIRPIAALMTMLNVRLNYWLPNPRTVAAHQSLFENKYNKVGPFYLLREMAGYLTNKRKNVDISDGGHFENLGVYELLRRECRLIIVGDGECDPELKFEAVSEVARLAQIDMGIIIDLVGLDLIRSGVQHYAVGKIKYANGREGALIYLKSSLLKDDSVEASLDSHEAYLTSDDRNDNRQYDSNPYIAHYKAMNPDFPHQTTADQFFDERQFECYRALGYMVTMRSIGNWQVDTNPPS
jgi:hypothetical protein